MVKPQPWFMETIRIGSRSAIASLTLPRTEYHESDSGEYSDEGKYYQQLDGERDESDESDQNLEQGDYECDHSQNSADNARCF